MVRQGGKGVKAECTANSPKSGYRTAAVENQINDGEI